MMTFGLISASHVLRDIEESIAFEKRLAEYSALSRTKKREKLRALNNAAEGRTRAHAEWNRYSDKWRIVFEQDRAELAEEEGGGS